MYEVFLKRRNVVGRQLTEGVFMQMQLSEGFFEKDVMRNFAELASKNLYRNLFLVFSCEFCETCEINFFAEQHRTTASEYSREYCIGKRTVNYDTKTKAYVSFVSEV